MSSKDVCDSSDVRREHYVRCDCLTYTLTATTVILLLTSCVSLTMLVGRQPEVTQDAAVDAVVSISILTF